jgi:hypothetical protein
MHTVLLSGFRHINGTWMLILLSMLSKNGAKFQPTRQLLGDLWIVQMHNETAYELAIE